jgi:hypothetical protein
MGFSEASKIPPILSSSPLMVIIYIKHYLYSCMADVYHAQQTTPVGPFVHLAQTWGISPGVGCRVMARVWEHRPPSPVPDSAGPPQVPPRGRWQPSVPVALALRCVLSHQSVHVHRIGILEMVSELPQPIQRNTQYRVQCCACPGAAVMTLLRWHP